MANSTPRGYTGQEFDGLGFSGDATDEAAAAASWWERGGGQPATGDAPGQPGDSRASDVLNGGLEDSVDEGVHWPDTDDEFYYRRPRPTSEGNGGEVHPGYPHSFAPLPQRPGASPDARGQPNDSHRSDGLGGGLQMEHSGDEDVYWPDTDDEFDSRRPWSTPASSGGVSPRHPASAGHLSAPNAALGTYGQRVGEYTHDYGRQRVAGSGDNHRAIGAPLPSLPALASWQGPPSPPGTPSVRGVGRFDDAASTATAPQGPSGAWARILPTARAAGAATGHARDGHREHLGGHRQLAREEERAAGFRHPSGATRPSGGRPGGIAALRAGGPGVQLLQDRAANGPTHVALPRHTNGQPVTTLTIINLPTELSARDIMSLIDRSGFARRYNYFYAPSDFRSGAHRGQGRRGSLLRGVGLRQDLLERSRAQLQGGRVKRAGLRSELQPMDYDAAPPH